MDGALKHAKALLADAGLEFEDLAEAICFAIMDAPSVSDPDAKPRLDLARTPHCAPFPPEAVGAALAALGGRYLSVAAGRPVHLAPGKPTMVCL